MTATQPPPKTEALAALTHLLHAMFMGLQLMVATREESEVVGRWMFRLFRRQHHEKFLTGLQKLGLEGLPHAVACARYHVLSNGIGGVPVQFMAESPRKAWVRFRYPRWMYQGAVICGVPVQTSRGLLEGWYAHNGVSLGNPRLGFVCVSEDMTGEFGLCGYFHEFDRRLADHERLQFRRGEEPPAFDAHAQPQLPQHSWGPTRRALAARNYALQYVRNGLIELAGVVGDERARELGGLAAKLIGLQYFAETASMIGVPDGDCADAARYLAVLFEAMGDHIEHADRASSDQAVIRQLGLQVVKGLHGQERNQVLQAWCELWRGALASQQTVKAATIEIDDDAITWRIHARQAQDGRR
jgi:hypothetical protein